MSVKRVFTVVHLRIKWINSLFHFFLRNLENEISLIYEKVGPDSRAVDHVTWPSFNWQNLDIIIFIWLTCFITIFKWFIFLILFLFVHIRFKFVNTLYIVKITNTLNLESKRDGLCFLFWGVCCYSDVEAVQTMVCCCFIRWKWNIQMQHTKCKDLIF